jgi:hypothetical protein
MVTAREVLPGVQGKSVRLMGGNTGYGIYKNWPDEDVIINVKSIPDMHALTRSEVGRSAAPPGALLPQ